MPQAARIVRTPQMEADAAKMQSFNHTLSTLDSASASSLSATPQLSIKLSGDSGRVKEHCLKCGVKCAVVGTMIGGSVGQRRGGFTLRHGGVFVIFFTGTTPFWGREGGKNKEESKIANVP
jgi:hypothetical protein